MKSPAKYRNPGILAGIALLVSGLLYAVAVFSPSTTPVVMIGKYVLQDNDLLQGDTRAYRPWFENGAWQGDLIEYDILQDGTRRTDAQVGSNPPVAGMNGWCGKSTGSGCWMARATFLDAEEAASPKGSYWEDRNIFTNNSGQVDFWWDNLTVAQKLALDAPTLANPDGDPTTDDAIIPTDTSTEGDDFSPILNYVRGDRSNERDQTDGVLRKRYSLLGDITATPAYVGPPRQRLGSYEGFTEWQTSHASRAGRIATPANDGMLHIFDEADGSEVYAYVPSMVIEKLPALAARNSAYNHTYYVAGDPVVGAAQVNAGTCTAENVLGCNWRTLLSGGGGAGFSGLYVLDMTDPDYPGSEGDKLLFEKSGSEFGHIYGKPVIAPLGTTADPDWYILTGNGYAMDDNSREAKLLLVSLDGANGVTSISTEPGTRGLSQPALLSTNNDLIADFAFAGDLNGDVWMFSINPDTATGDAIRIFAGSPEQPITTTPTLTEHPSLPGSYLLYFGTGSLLSMVDALNDTSAQSVYGILIRKGWLDDPSTITPITSSQLGTQNYASGSKDFTDDNTDNPELLRFYSSPAAVDYSNVDIAGWKVNLDNCGERLVGDPFLRAERLQFVTTNPTGPDPNCGKEAVPGDSWLMSLHFLTGGDGDEVAFNLNDDSTLDTGDTINGKPPVGLNLGLGNIAQPSIARLRRGIDKMYINGIILPVPEISSTGAILSGHIDVQTDSPYSGKEAVNDRFRLSEGYNVKDADGLGQAIDGHVHGYDTVHLVDYVDMFELEPRRGLLSPDPDTAGETLEAELNRAYDTYTFVDPVTNDTGATVCPGGSEAILGANDEIIQCRQTPQSEVYADELEDSRFPKDQKFIVVLANADLSFSGTLQIGCRAWPVVEYENMVTAALEAQFEDTGTHLVPGEPLPSFFSTKNLVFTLADILADPSEKCPVFASDSDTQISVTEAVKKGLSLKPTLRVGFGERSILDEGLHGTRAQCVLGLHHYEDKACYSDETVLSAAEAALAHPYRETDDSISKLKWGASNRGGTGDGCALFNGVKIANDPNDLPIAGHVPDYIRDPAWNMHVTHIKEGSRQGYRWRNGALTLQLLAVDADGNVDFTLQPPTEEVLDSSGETITKKNLMVSKNRRFGGTHARAWGWYQEQNADGSWTEAVFHTNDDPSEGEVTVGPDHSGLLYESSMFWHYSDLNDGLRNADPDSTSAPQDTNCYGHSNYQSALTKERGGLTLGEYNSLVNPLLDECDAFVPPEDNPDDVCDLEKYISLVRTLENATDEDEINQALLELANLVAANDLLSEYVKYRDYAPGHVPEQHLQEIDRGQLSDNVDGTQPEGEQPVCDPSQDQGCEPPLHDRETKGPNEVLGRRNWIDLRQ